MFTELTPRSVDIRPEVVEEITEEQVGAQFQWMREKVNDDDKFRAMLQGHKGDILMLAAEVQYPETADLSKRTKFYDQLKIAGAEILKMDFLTIEPDEIVSRMMVVGNDGEKNLRAYVLAQMEEESNQYDWPAQEPEDEILLIEDDLQANASQLLSGRRILQQSTISNAVEIVWKARVKELEEIFEGVFGIANDNSLFGRAFNVDDAGFTISDEEKNDLFEYRDRLVNLGVKCCEKGQVARGDEDELAEIFIETQEILLKDGNVSKFTLDYFIREFEKLIPHGPELGPGEPEETKRQVTDELPDWLRPKEPEEKKLSRKPPPAAKRS